MLSGRDRRNPAMTDVARVAGVSHQTVSRVLNGHPNVRESTRERVLAAIDQLAYRRNHAARALVTRRTETLGVVAFDTTLYGPASTLFGVEQAAREAGYFLSIVSLKAITRSTVDDALGYLAGQSVDGLIVIAPQRQAVEALAAVPKTLPVVAVEGGRAPDLPVGGLFDIPIRIDDRLPPEAWRLEYADGQRFESHVCRWELGARQDPSDWRPRRHVPAEWFWCSLLWSDDVRCDQRTVDPGEVRRTERLVSGISATGGPS